MKKLWRWILVFFGFSLPITTSCEKEEEPVLQYSDIEIKIFEEINEQRVFNNAPMCKINNSISAVAKTHSQFMAEKLTVSHDNFAKRADTLMCKVSAKSVGEVVGFGYSTAAGVVMGWEKSESHRRVIFGKGWTHFGVSVVRNIKGNYITLIFTRQ